MAFSNPVDTASSGNPLVDGLLWGKHWSDGSAATTSLAVYIAGVSGNEQFDFGGTLVTANTVSEEAAAFQQVMAMFESFCNIDFTVASSQADADIIAGAVNNRDADGALGIATPPGEDTGPLATQQGSVIINFKAYQTDDLSSLEVGGYDFISFIHEFGHAVGLKHPHDRGGGVFPKFPGVNGAFGDFGDFDLNQGIFTMMSYNDGFPAGPDGEQSPSAMPGFGWEGTPMALDIAAMQHLYGANMSYRTGNDVYTLPILNQAGTYYSCIWDAGGIDAINAGGSDNCVINLNAASLQLKPGGGGYVSMHAGIFGGFTIANGAVIENASSGAGNDKLIGNKVGNVMAAGNGADKLKGGQGADFLFGQGGADTFIYARARDSRDSAIDTITDFIQGEDTIDLSRLDGDGKSGTAGLFDFIGSGAFTGTAGELRFGPVSSSSTVIEADINGDGNGDFTIILQGGFTLLSTDFDL